MPPVQNDVEDSADFEEELAGINLEDEQALAETRELEQMDALEGQRQQERKQKSLASQVATQQVKKQLTRGLLRITAPYWGSVVLGLILIFSIIIFVSASVVSVCQSSYTDGVQIAAMKLVVAAIPGDICSQLAGKETGTGTGTAQPPLATGTLTDAQAREALRVGGVSVNALQPQTSLEGIQTATVLEIVRFKRDCDAWANSQGPVIKGPCTVLFTGGTETTGGHEGGPCSHLSGHKADVGTNDLVNKYITSTFTHSGSRSGDPQYKNPVSGVFYVNETNHWDIGGVGCA